jgi:P4 family phage/plasmid primase-like protien
MSASAPVRIARPRIAVPKFSDFDPLVKKSPVVVKSEEIISLPPVEEMAQPVLRPIEGMCARYEELGLHWERCRLEWDEKTQKKKGVAQHQGKYADGTGVILHCEGLLAIDIDGDCDKCREIYELCDAECVMKAKTRKGHHFFFRADPRFKMATGDAVKIDLRTGKPSIVLVEPSFYNHPDGVVQYKWERFPTTMDELTETPKAVAEWLLENPRYCSDDIPKKMKKPIAKKEEKVENEIVYPEKPPKKAEDEVEEMRIVMANPPPILSITEQVDALCGCLTPEWIGEHTNWLKLMYAMKNTSATHEMKEIFLRHSARAPQFDTPSFYKQNGKAWDGLKAGGRSGIGSIKHWAKKCNPERYFQLSKGSNEALLAQGNANGLCEIFYNAMAGDIMYSVSEKCYYTYDDTQKLWKKMETTSQINWLFSETMNLVFRKMMAEFPIARTEAEVSARKEKIKMISEANKQCGGPYAITLVSSFLPAICIPSEDPALYFNQNPDLYPLENGVWKFSEKKLIPYEREHYFTFRIPIAYNPKADTTHIRKAVMDWFAQDKEVADFVKMFIGYCLTGHTTRQEFLIVWGTKAGNGKSLLFGTILSLLLGPYYHIITSDALSTERVGNNDQLYNLNGKRFAFLSEPRRAKGTKLDNEIVKTLTGDKSFTCEAKYKNAITFTLQAKFAMACNDMPDLKFDDKGIYRRVLVAEQNCEFVDEKDYEERSEEEKTSKKVLKKDDDFVAELLANKEGLLFWALEGANLYTDNPRMAPPKAMASAKDKAQEEVNVIGAWIRQNLRKLEDVPEANRPANWAKAKVKFSQIKDRLRQRNINIGQNVMGFNKRFTEKLTAMGYEVGGREDKGDQYVKKVDFYEDADESDEE